jgi:quercetin dioxygenase-like cupin family protein
VDTATSDGVHEVVIALKDTAPGPTDAPPPGTPTSFPRTGADKMLEGDRFIVWHFSWIPNTPVAMHHHDKDTVMVFRYDGTLRSTAPSGAVQDNVFKQGQINYSKAGNTHTETLVTDHQSAVDLELK